VKTNAPFTPHCLAELDAKLLAPASAVVRARDAWLGLAPDGAVVLRHDVDGNPGSLEAALRLAEWEADRGYRSTFYLLHTADYWMRDGFVHDVRYLEAAGHEVGIHADAIGQAVERGGDPNRIFANALARLRSCGVEVIGVAAHGNPLCRVGGELVFVNDEIFEDCPRPECGDPRRLVYDSVRIDPRPLSWYGLAYAVERLPYAGRLSDSGGRWTPLWRNRPSVSTGHLHFLMHPDWWTDAL